MSQKNLTTAENYTLKYTCSSFFGYLDVILQAGLRANNPPHNSAFALLIKHQLKITAQRAAGLIFNLQNRGMSTSRIPSKLSILIFESSALDKAISS